MTKSTAKPKSIPETRSTPRQRLVGRRRPPIDPVDVEFPEDAGEDAYVAANLAGLRTGRVVLPQIALAEALGAAGLRRLQSNDSLSVVIEVPSPDWIPHIEAALRAICSWAYIACKSGSSRMSDKPSEGNDKVSSYLSNGARVAGVSQSPARYLPATLVSGADLYVRVGPISNRSVSRMIRAATGMRPRRLPRGLAAGLDFDTATACVRLGGTPQEAVKRLQAATAALSGGDALLDGVPALEDLHGFGSAMTWSKALVRDVDAWREGRMEWQDISRSCLWASEPGLGKTTLARAVAKAARVPLVSMSLGELFATSDGYLGGVLRAAEQAFQRAAANAPAVLFIDECDSIPDRSTLDARAREWWTPLVNFFLTSIEALMTGRSSRVIVIGATNNPHLLDPALVRPGRLHPLIHIQRPDAADLARIFRGHLAEDLPGEDLTGVAHIATGATGADVVAWVKEARATARAAARRMTLQDLVTAVAPGDERSDDELRIVARHEAAHACASLYYDLGILRSVTIEMGRSSAGATRAAIHPRQFHTREQIEAIVVTSLAGRAMDQLGGAVNSGSGGGRDSDLSKATAMIAQMHGSLCMGDSLVYRGGPEDVATVLAMDPSLRHVVERDLQKLYGRACAYVREHAPAIEAVAERLLTDRVLTGEVVREIVQAYRRPACAMAKGGRDVR